jgi:hypothetical protein
MGVLVRQEVGLATTEVSHKASRAAGDVAAIAAGGLVAYAGFLAIVGAAIVALAAAGLEWWQAAALMGILVTVIGGVLIRRGLSALKHADLMPHETLQTLKEDTRWAKDQIS